MCKCEKKEFVALFSDQTADGVWNLVVECKNCKAVFKMNNVLLIEDRIVSGSNTTIDEIEHVYFQ